MTQKILVAIDIQREYVTPGRPFHIASIAPSLANAQVLLQYARSHAWPVVHVQHLQDGAIFNRDAEYSRFVDGFTPIEGETSVTKGNYSSFSAPAFTDFVQEQVQAHTSCEFVVVGYGTTMCCLSTIVEGYHRGYSFALVQDATAALANGDLTEDSMHRHTVALMGRFARVTSTTDETAA
jgi:ureidoacrylate peracid hydrolase